MSDATLRHVNALAMKYELLREIKHWQKSCTQGIKDIARGITAMREARANIKQQINSARARLEARLRELEACAEKQLNTIAGLEEDSMKELLSKLADNKKRLANTESVLNENLIGLKLKRSMEDGKHQMIDVRKALVEYRKYNLPTGLTFELDPTIGIQNVSLMSLGQTRVQPSHEDSKRSTTTQHDDVGCFITANGDCGDEHDIVRDIETLFALDGKYEHSLKPFLDSVRDLSVKYNTSEILKKDASFKKITPELPATYIKTVQIKNPVRPQSEVKPRKNDAQRPVMTRLSKSARDDGIAQRSTCLNDIEIVPFEEQGPERSPQNRSEKPKPRTSNVRYSDIDYVKEITALEDIAVAEDKELRANTNITQGRSFIPYPVPKLRGVSGSSQGSTSTSMSSVSYKPTNSLASRPVNITASENSQSNSYFKYVAKFHTKKHPDETDLCRLAGITCLDNGQVIVTDINHLQIMLFGPDYHYLDSLECPSPSGVTTVNSNTVAVALFHNRKIMLVKVHTIHLERFREFHIPCNDTLFDVTSRGGGFFVLCSAGDVHVLNDEGKQINVLSACAKKGEGRHIEVSLDQTMIFISCSDKVVCINNNGEQLWQYSRTSAHRRFASVGLVWYNHRLFVADWCGHKVIELSTEGSYVRDVIVDHVEYPQALAICQTTGRMLATQNNQFKQEARSRGVKVFAIK